MKRQQTILNGSWRFQPDVWNEGERPGYFKPGHDRSSWLRVKVPGSFDQCHPALATYEGKGWYRRTFRAPNAWRDMRIVLHFEGVNYRARVWLNGKLLGQNLDGFLPFEFPIHDVVQWGRDNDLVVCADSTRYPEDVPGRERGWRTFGGILREVSLRAMPHTHLAGIRVIAEPEGNSGKIGLKITVAAARALARVGMEVEILGRQGHAVATFLKPGITLKAGRTMVQLGGTARNVKPWTPEHPSLYRARVILSRNGQVLDTDEVRFGFRRIEVRGTQLLLNGKPVMLRGFNRHEDSPRTGMCPDMATVSRDITAMKATGANFVRLCHYPHHPAELDLCDERGLLVMDEIPLYWWKGLAEGKATYRRKLAAAKRQLAAMIERDRNHPSIIIWSVSNETEEFRPAVRSGNAQLVKLAQRLDPTRPVTHVSSRWTQHPAFKADDIISVNAYPTWDGYAADPSYNMADSARFWRRSLAELHARWPDKPILVTEFGYPSVEGMAGNPLGEDRQAEAIRTEFRGMGASYVCGTIIWCWADHPWPEESFIRYMTTSPFGVVTRDRRALRALACVREIFRR